MIKDGTYIPHKPGASTLAEVKPLTLNGAKVTIQVWSVGDSRYLDLFAGEGDAWHSIYADTLPGELTTMVQLFSWADEYVKAYAWDLAVRADWDKIYDSCTSGSQRWHAMMGAAENADLTMQEEGGTYGDKTSTRWFEVAIAGFESNMSTGEYVEPEDESATYAARVPNVILDYARESETTQVDLSALTISPRTYSSLVSGTRKEMTALADYVEHLTWMRESGALGRDELNYAPAKLRPVSERIYQACENIVRLPS